MTEVLITDVEAGRLLGCSAREILGLACIGMLGFETAESENGRTQRYFSKNEIERRQMYLEMALAKLPETISRPAHI